MTRPLYGTRAHELRAALAATPWLTCAELVARCAACDTTTQAAALLAQDLRNGLVTRNGPRHGYRYALTTEGQRALDNPNYLRRAARRRTHGRRVARPSILQPENRA